MLAAFLLGVGILECTEATYWFKTSGTAMNLGACTSAHYPASNNEWCNPILGPYNMVENQPDVYLGDAESAYWFTWTVPGQVTFTSALNISGSWSSAANEQASIRVQSTTPAKVILSNFDIRTSSPLKLQLEASEVIFNHVTITNAQPILFDEVYGYANYNITILNMNMTYTGSAFTFPTLGQVKRLIIYSSTFEQVGLRYPAAPIFEFGITDPSDSVDIRNVSFTAPTAISPSVYPYLIRLRAKDVEIRDVTMSELVTTPIEFHQVANISISFSRFTFLENAPDYGCWKCSEIPIVNYTKYSGVALKIMGNLDPAPTVRLLTNQFTGVTAFLNDEGAPAQMEAPRFYDNYFWKCGIQASPSASSHLEIAFNEIEHWPTGLGYDHELFPALYVRGDFVSDNNNIGGAPHYTKDPLCLTIFVESSMLRGWLQMARGCISGNLTLLSTATLSNVGYLGPWDGHPSPKVVIKDSGALQVQSSIFDTVSILGETGSKVAVYISYPVPSYFNSLINGASIVADYIYPSIDREVKGVEPGYSLAIGNGTWTSLSNNDFDFLDDYLRGYQGFFATNGSDFTVVINQTQCRGICLRGAPCKERFTSCNCSAKIESLPYGGPLCGCILAGKPGAAQCDLSGALGWVIEHSWDLPTDKVFKIPEGYSFKIKGDCILNGTLELAPNTTFVTGGAFRNSGNLTVSSTLTKVDLGSGNCGISSSTTISTSSVTFDPNSIVKMEFDATQLEDASSCSSTSKRTIDSTNNEFNPMSVFQTRDSENSQISLGSSSTATFATNGSASLSGNWTVILTTTPTTKANITLAKSDPSSSSISLLVSTTTSDPNSCATTDSSPGLLTIFVAPCSSPTTPNNKPSSVKWWYYGIPIIVVGVIAIVAAIVILFVPSVKAAVLPYRR